MTREEKEQTKEIVRREIQAILERHIGESVEDVAPYAREIIDSYSKKFEEFDIDVLTMQFNRETNEFFVDMEINFK